MNFIVDRLMVVGPWMLIREVSAEMDSSAGLIMSEDSVREPQ